MTRAVPHPLQATRPRRLLPLSRATALLLTLAPVPGGADEALRVGQAIHVTGSGVRLRAAPGTHADVLAEVEPGRWLQAEEIGALATFDAHDAPWVRVSDPFAPTADGPFVGASAGWIWGGLLAPIPDTITPPSVTAWERVILRLDPATSAPAVASSQGEAIAWALHALPSGDSAALTLELGEWQRLGAPPRRTSTTAGWRALSLVTTVHPGDGGTWLMLQGLAADGSERVELRPSMIPGAPLALEVGSRTRSGRHEADLLFEDLDGDAILDLAVLDRRSDPQGATTELTLRRHGFRDGAVRDLAGSTTHEVLLPASNLRLSPPELDATPPELPGRPPGRAARFLLVCDGAASGPTTLVVHTTALSGWSHGPRRVLASTTTRVPVPGLLPGQQLPIQMPLGALPPDAQRVIVEGVLLPADPETTLGDNRALGSFSP